MQRTRRPLNGGPGPAKFRSRLTYSNVVASIALFVSLGGGAFAASGVLIKKSKQVAKGAINSSDLADRKGVNVVDLTRSARQALVGKTGPQGSKGDKGDQGAIGPAGPFPGVLPSGKTLRGAYDVQDTASGAGQVAEAGYPFIFTLASKPAVHYISSTGTPPPECPGTNDAPEAQPGHLCVYENVKANTSSVLIADPETNTGNGSSEEGFYLLITSSGAGFFSSDGTWAVTSP
jgi:hypothetical protein